MCLIHDLIPITHPEFARPQAAVAHAAQIGAVSRLANGIIVHSQSTPEVLLRLGTVTLPPERVRLALLGTELTLPFDATRPLPRDPYFVFIGTIEPRKNHLLLLNDWTRMAEHMGNATPHLALIGRQG